MFAHKHRYLFIVLLAVYTYLNTVLCEVYKYFHIEIEWYVAFGTIMAITLLTWESSRLLEPRFKKIFHIREFKISTLAMFFIAGSILTTIITVGIVFFVSMVLHHYTVSESFIPLKLNLIYAWLANLLFHLLNAIKFYFTEYKTKWMEAEELKRISAQAELQLVKSQINPHFLFNNLNVLSALIMKNNNEANKFIEEFSKVYRYILTTHDKELVDIKTELNFIKPYIFLLGKRFAEGLEIVVDVPEAYEKFYVIPASLQMLIENAIKHNVVSKNKPLHIDVHVNGNNTIVVKNNLQLRESVDNSTKVGLNNIIKRYWLFSGQKVEVKNDNEAFTVTLPLLTLN
ncbi:sensor histidine kinase [Ferruginibacter sp. SUN106]|uniref:sensor histidine kinase n=1 Tax=Ferruginibacter sp. SUN106 TaxID=2978348 RepID=UPI003D36699D